MKAGYDEMPGATGCPPPLYTRGEKKGKKTKGRQNDDCGDALKSGERGIMMGKGWEGEKEKETIRILYSLRQVDGKKKKRHHLLGLLHRK